MTRLRGLGALGCELQIAISEAARARHSGNLHGALLTRCPMPAAHPFPRMQVDRETFANELLKDVRL